MADDAKIKRAQKNLDDLNKLLAKNLSEKERERIEKQAQTWVDYLIRLGVI